MKKETVKIIRFALNNPSLNKQISLKKALSFDSVREVKEICKTAGGKAQLMLFDSNHNLIGFTKFYDVKKLRKSVSLWLFRDFLMEV